MLAITNSVECWDDQRNPYDMVSVKGKIAKQINGEVTEQHIIKLANLGERQIFRQAVRLGEKEYY